jgi:glycosyltransferase involved in cell wall biosynthesis
VDADRLPAVAPGWGRSGWYLGVSTLHQPPDDRDATAALDDRRDVRLVPHAARNLNRPHAARFRRVYRAEQGEIVASTRRILFVVSADLPTDRPIISDGPRKDYIALIESLHPTVLDRTRVRRSAAGRLAERLFGTAVTQALLAFRQHRRYDVVITDGEHIGIPLALMLKAVGATVAHVTIGHRLSTPKKRPFFRWLRVHSHMNRIALHSKLQYDIATTELGIPRDQVMVIPFQTDTAFWRPQSVPEERLVSSAGLEHRDYRTLFQAVEGLDADVVIGAASQWSRQPNTAIGPEHPANVTVDSFDYAALRDVFARSSVVVVPLFDVDFQAGITTILEAMAMGKAVVVTRAAGQTDVVEDRRLDTGGTPAGPRPLSLLRELAQQAGLPVEPNGLYVPPSDPAALRRAIEYLLDHPDERAQLGAAARRTVERFMSVEHFAARMGAWVEGATRGVDHPADAGGLSQSGSPAASAN